MATKEKTGKDRAQRERARGRSDRDGDGDRDKPGDKPAERSERAGGARRGAVGDEIRLGALLGAGSVLDIDVATKEELLRRLAEAIAIDHGYPSAEQILRSALERESLVNTYLGDGVAVPHARVSSFDGFAMAIARSKTGFPYGVDTSQPVHLVFFVVGNEALQSEHVRLLAAIAGLVNDAGMREEILAAADSVAVARLLDSGVKASRRRPHQITRMLLSHSRKIARGVGANAILLAIENAEELALLRRLPRRETFIVATRSPRIAESAEKIVSRVLRLPRNALGHTTLVRLGTLMAISKGFISRDDVVAFLSGKPDGSLDTITVISISKEFGRFINASGEISSDIASGVLERVLVLASELAVEGREGKPIGTIFVIGDPQALAPYCQQLIINPFHGYPEEQRNILDPTLRETVKEFASIDGAFIVRGNGVLHSAGTYLRPGEVAVEMPGGYGTRHRAACAITAVCDCVSVTISESTGNLVLYKNGAVVMTTDKVL